MPTRRCTLGYATAACGAAGLILSLWAPWYWFRIPRQVIQGAEQISTRAGALGSLIRQGAEIASHLGPIHLSAWQILTDLHVVLIVVGVLAGGLALLAASGRATGTAKILAAAGGLAAILVAYRIISPPGSSGLLHVDWGAVTALVGSLALFAGGLVADREEARVAGGLEPAPAWPPQITPEWGAVAECREGRTVASDQPAQWAAAASVAPPGAD